MIRATWHIATSSLAGKPGRYLLLTLALALATAMTVMVAAGMSTLTAAVVDSSARLTRLADLELTHAAGRRLEADLVRALRDRPEVESATAQLRGQLLLRHPDTGRVQWAQILGVDPQHETAFQQYDLAAGRWFTGANQLIAEADLLDALEVRVGEPLQLQRPGADPLRLTLAGSFDRPMPEMLQRLQQPLALAPLASAQRWLDAEGQVDRIELRLHAGVDADAFRQQLAPLQARGIEFHTAAAAEAGLQRGLRALRLALVLATLVVSLAAGFIVLTSLTASVIEQTRELAILRSIGAGRSLVAAGQLAVGLILAVLAATLGVPLGLALAYAMYLGYADDLTAGFHVDLPGLGLALAGTALACLAGAAYPAWLAARITPLSALRLQARQTKPAAVLACLLVGLLLAGFQPLVMTLPLDAQTAFNLYVYLGLLLSFLGYFLLGVPVVIALAFLLAPPLAWLLRLPRQLLQQTVLTRPFRHGFVGGALMVGLAVFVSIWTASQSVLTDWLDRLHMPDVFVYAPQATQSQQWRALEESPHVRHASHGVMLPVGLGAFGFGVEQLAHTRTLFVGVDPDSFLHTAPLQWVAGDPDSARQQLHTGRAVIVTEQYQAAHDIGLGDDIQLQTRQGETAFRVAGIVGSAGLDIAAQFFQMQEVFEDVAVGVVIGSFAQAQEHFNVRSPNFSLLSLTPNVDPDQAHALVRAELPGALAISGQEIRNELTRSARRFTTLSALIAAATLLVACFGVANLIAAEVAGRRFELGVLRSIGGQRAMVARLILAQAALLAVAAAVTGTALGLQLALVGRAFHHRLVGLVYDLALPGSVVFAAATLVVLAAILAAAPTALHLMRQRPSALLAAGRDA